MTLPAPARSLFRPDGDGAPSTQRMIQRHRLLALLGTILVLGLGALYDATNPDAVTSAAARLGIASLFLGLFEFFCDFWCLQLTRPPIVHQLLDALTDALVPGVGRKAALEVVLRSVGDLGGLRLRL